MKNVISETVHAILKQKILILIFHFFKDIIYSNVDIFYINTLYNYLYKLLSFKTNCSNKNQTKC